MSKIAVVTDSNSGITQAEGKKLGINVIPMPFMIGENEFFEDINLSQDEFYEKLKGGENISTSQPNLTVVADFWRNLLKDYDEIIHIPMSSGLSGSCQSAYMLSQEDEFESDSVMDCFLLAINYDIKENKERHIFEFVTKFDIQDCFGFDENSLHLDGKARKLAAKLKLTELTVKQKKAIKLLCMNIKKMSGGQKKLTNIVTNLIRYEFSDLLLLDEPLNNLDYNNVRSFSNVLTRIYRSKPGLGIVLVTHCRSIPIVNRVIEIDAGKKTMFEADNYSCSSCFGKVDELGYYA